MIGTLLGKLKHKALEKKEDGIKAITYRAESSCVETQGQ